MLSCLYLFSRTDKYVLTTSHYRFFPLLDANYLLEKWTTTAKSHCYFYFKSTRYFRKMVSFITADNSYYYMQLKLCIHSRTRLGLVHSNAVAKNISLSFVIYSLVVNRNSHNRFVLQEIWPIPYSFDLVECKMLSTIQ